MRVMVCAIGLVLFFSRSVSAQEVSRLYQTACGTCHDSGQTRAPNRQALAQLTADRILQALERGSMSYMGLALLPAQRQALATYLSGKAFSSVRDTVSVGTCKDAKPMPSNALTSANWSGWSVDLVNSRFQNAASAGISLDLVGSLKLKWAFAFPDEIVAYSQPAVVGGRVFVGSPGGRVYSLDRETGCSHWSFTTESGVRTAITVANVPGTNRLAAYFGDLAANVYAIDAANGALIWKKKVDNHPAARITGTPKLHGGRLYVPVSSAEEFTAALPNYECCTFRGSVVALDARNGSLIWKTHTIKEEPRQTKKSKSGTQLWGPSGVAIWSSPTIDVQKSALYVTTGDGYSLPFAKTADAVLAFDLASGRLLWTRQLTENDSWNVSCVDDRSNCPENEGPDFDFGSSAILVELGGGRRALIAGQKSGQVHALDPDRSGQILWQVKPGRGGVLGGIQWGPAADSQNVYVAVSDFDFSNDGLAPSGGGLYAFRLADGKEQWKTMPPQVCSGRPGCSPAQSSAVTVIPGVVFSGSLDGHLRAYDAKTGKILWDYDTAKSFATVNGVAGKGGSIDSAGPVVVNGMVFVNSGYATFGAMAGNVLLAFEISR